MPLPLAVLIVSGVVLLALIYNSSLSTINKNLADNNEELILKLSSAKSENLILKSIIDDLHKKYKLSDAKDKPKSKNKHILKGNE
jgi:hypothetical protein